MKQRIREIIASSLEKPVDSDVDEVLFGPDGRLDSLGLVNLLADIEMAVSEESGCEIVLASEKAMSKKRSPFRDIESLVAFTYEAVCEARGANS